MCKTYQKLPSDPWFEELDEIEKLWMYQSWMQDQEDKIELAKSHGILIGSFTNYEAAKRMMDSGNPSASSTEEEFEQATQKVIEDRSKNLQQETNANPIRRRRKAIK